MRTRKRSKSPSDKKPGRGNSKPSRRHDATDAASASKPPKSLSTLYDDAFHSILGFLSLRQLVGVMRVSRKFVVAVRTMPPIAANVMIDELDHFLVEDAPAPALQLLRHVSRVSSDPERVNHLLYASQLSQFVSHAPNLRSLHCGLRLPVAHLPSSLVELDILSLYTPPTVGSNTELFNSLLDALSGLAHLESLRIPGDYSLKFADVDFSRLHPPSLRHLRFLSGDKLMPKQIKQLRAPSFDQLEAFDLCGSLPADQWRELLEGERERKWKKFHVRSDSGLDDDDKPTMGFPRNTDESTMLAALGGTLEQLKVRCFDDLSFLPRLPKLTDLTLKVFQYRQVAAGAWEAVAASMVFYFHSPLLTKLDLRVCPLTSNDMAEILSRLPRLTSLSLDRLLKLGSLEFFAQSAAALQSLQKLELKNLLESNRAEVEFEHLSGLKALTELTIADVAQASRLHSESVLDMTTVTWFPQLQRLDYFCGSDFSERWTRNAGLKSWVSQHHLNWLAYEKKRDQEAIDLTQE